MFANDQIQVDSDYAREIAIVADELFAAGRDIDVHNALTILLGGREPNTTASTVLVSATRLLEHLGRSLASPDEAYLEFTDRVAAEVAGIWRLNETRAELTVALLRSVSNGGGVDDLDEISRAAIMGADEGWLAISLMQAVLAMSYMLSEDEPAGDPLRVLLDLV